VPNNRSNGQPKTPDPARRYRVEGRLVAHGCAAFVCVLAMADTLEDATAWQAFWTELRWHSVRVYCHETGRKLA